ncbi:ATP-dependent zinc protease [Neptunicella marina]|uniref:ATP-dependent zinc protease n=2 Tax=Neptunicella marina TaxID=2125989 RepID=A0A8J6IU96_9ALTE|nr:ATP-dependent zinc protease [Neptunicella marina]
MQKMKTTLGWREWVALPDLELASIKAKVDTGAKTSCLHAFNLEPFEKDGENWIKIWLHPNQDDNETEHQCEARIIDQRSVRDSGGHEEIRYVVETTLELAGQCFPIELTLTNRDSMKFRMLLGRQAMLERFIVNPTASYLIKQPS